MNLKPLLIGMVLFASLVAALPGQGARSLTNCPAGTTNDGEELSFLSIINSYRAQNGLGRLSVSVNLTRAAKWKANDMATKDYFSHTDSLGRSPWTLTVDCGYPIAGGENLAAGTDRSTGSSAFDLFRNSPSHNANMLDARYQQIGIGRAFVGGSHYGWYWATEFGTTNDAAPASAPAPPRPAASAAPAPTAPPDPAPAAPAPPQRVELEQASPETFATGVTFFTWEGASTGIAQAMPCADGRPRTLYTFDNASEQWLHYVSGAPAKLQDFAELEQGRVYWAVTGEAGE